MHPETGSGFMRETRLNEYDICWFDSVTTHIWKLLWKALDVECRTLLGGLQNFSEAFRQYSVPVVSKVDVFPHFVYKG